MEKLLKILMFSSLAILLSVGSAMAVPSTLYDILGYAGNEAYSDTGAEAAYLTDTDGTADNATAFLFLEIASYANQNTFGIYGFLTNADGSVSLGNTLEVFDGPDAQITSTTLAFDISAGTVTNNGVVASIGTTFGFYITTPQDLDPNDNVPAGFTYYSHTSLNTLDNYDHMMIFDTSDNVVGSLLGSDIVIAVEDLYGGGDQDFTDMVIGINDVSPAPVPEPATILLLGLGLVGLAGISRKRKKT